MPDNLYSSSQLSLMNLQHFRQNGIVHGLFLINDRDDFPTSVYQGDSLDEGLQLLQENPTPFVAVYENGQGDISIYCSPCQEEGRSFQADLGLNKVWQRVTKLF